MIGRSDLARVPLQRCSPRCLGKRGEGERKREREKLSHVCQPVANEQRTRVVMVSSGDSLLPHKPNLGRVNDDLQASGWIRSKKKNCMSREGLSNKLRIIIF